MLMVTAFLNNRRAVAWACSVATDCRGVAPSPAAPAGVVPAASTMPATVTGEGTAYASGRCRSSNKAQACRGGKGLEQ